MNNAEMRAYELWQASDAQWIEELSRYHPTNLGNGNLGVQGPARISGLQEAKELAVWVHGAIVGYVNRNMLQLKEEICVNLNYCEKIKKGIFETDGWSVAVSVSDSLLMSATNLPVPVLMFSVYVVKNKILDTACACDSSR